MLITVNGEKSAQIRSFEINESLSLSGEYQRESGNQDPSREFFITQRTQSYKEKIKNDRPTYWSLFFLLVRV